MSGSIPDQVITSPRIAWSFDAAAPISGDAGVYGTEVYFGSDVGVFFKIFGRADGENSFPEQQLR